MSEEAKLQNAAHAARMVVEKPCEENALDAYHATFALMDAFATRRHQYERLQRLYMEALGLKFKAERKLTIARHELDMARGDWNKPLPIEEDDE